MIRKIPSTMASQHPDNAGKPYWNNEEFISTNQETKECYLMYSELGIPEYKWDWEGKLVDESVIERLLGEHFDYFKKNRLGKEKFLTFRLPNPKVETEFRLGRALMGILSAAGLAKQIGIHCPPIFEVILPMTESAEEIIAIQEAFEEIASLKHPLYNFEKEMMKRIEVIPLFEQVSTLCRSDRILEKYLTLHQRKFGAKPSYLRPYLARSDPALNSGLVPTILAIKIALSLYRDFENRKGVQLYPIIGTGSLPFRGGLTPETVEQFIQEYGGIRTALLQSAFRYDFEKTKVKTAVKRLDDTLPKGRIKRVSPTEKKKLQELIPYFETYYRQTIEEIAPLINHVAGHLPRRRERVLHIGLFGYSRGVGKVKLPRAIGFTAALYSLGVPPELIGTGRGLRKAIRLNRIGLLEKHYHGLRTDLIRSGRFLNKENLQKLASRSSVWESVLKDVSEVEKYLGENLSPVTKEEFEHQKMTGEIYKRVRTNDPLGKYIQKAAVLRKSLG